MRSCIRIMPGGKTRNPNDATVFDQLNKETPQSWCPKEGEYTKTQKCMMKILQCFGRKWSSNYIPQTTTMHTNQPSKEVYY